MITGNQAKNLSRTLGIVFREKEYSTKDWVKALQMEIKDPNGNQKELLEIAKKTLSNLELDPKYYRNIR